MSSEATATKIIKYVETSLTIRLARRQLAVQAFALAQVSRVYYACVRWTLIRALLFPLNVVYLRSGVCFSKAPKLFGPTSGTLIHTAS